MVYARFEENLFLYGADLSAWPEMLRIEAKALLAENRVLQMLLDEAQAFEAEARLRPTLADDASFPERIIALARTKHPALSWKLRVQLMLHEAANLLPFPKPAYALVSLALAGFVMGIMTQETATAAVTATSIFDISQGMI
jgi:hypothetical protein